ncbi:MAG: hypothetical protein AW07_01252 [Candidatus Accumulibacter sp. SK-11]|nr:MAG: hypothetical protein AW07_01252 [Candidatus Accumulibacter sp. SK-11]
MHLDPLALEQPHGVQPGLRAEEVDQTGPEEVHPGRLFGIPAALCPIHGMLLRKFEPKVVRPLSVNLRLRRRFVNPCRSRANRWDEARWPPLRNVVRQVARAAARVLQMSNWSDHRIPAIIRPGRSEDAIAIA